MKIRRNFQISLSLAMILSLLIVGGGEAAPVEGTIVDHFDESQSVSVTLPTTTGSSFQTATSAMGGERDILITNTAGTDGLSAITQSNPGGNSLLSISFDANVIANVQVQWDGADNDPVAVDTTGLGGMNLLENGQDRFLLGVSFTDNSFDLNFQVYEGVNCSESTVTIPDNINSSNLAVVSIPFSAFTNCGVTAADLTNAGAIVMNVVGEFGLDFQLHFIQITSASYMDFGDAPDSYGTVVASDGARHTLTNDIYLGATDNPEVNGDDDPFAGSHTDDDGVTPSANWGSGSADLDILVSGSEPGCLSIWMDFSSSNTFDGSFAGDLVLDNYALGAGAGSVPISLDLGALGINPNGEAVFARFRVIPDTYANGCISEPTMSPTGLAFGGEVEDYYWSFGPTAIELQSLDAYSNPRNNIAITVAGFVLLAAGIFIAVATRRRKI